MKIITTKVQKEREKKMFWGWQQNMYKNLLQEDRYKKIKLYIF